MFAWLSSEMQQEIADLAQRYGPSQMHIVEMGANSYLRQGTRLCEVCMVIRRPNGRLLTMKKTFYPTGAYRLPTGGIEPGESILNALQRELQEETGLTTTLIRFLGAIVYHMESRPRFATFAFLLEETGGVLQTNDPDEQLEAFQEIDIDTLPLIIEQMSKIGHHYGPEIASYWDDWGRFRIAVHRLVWECLYA
jgi:8-oxo-dGTP pyrophosphatase MutT (NUDIX family)